MRRLLIAIALLTAILGAPLNVRAASYCGKTSGTEQGGFTGHDYTMTLNGPSSVGVPSAAISGAVTSVLGMSQWARDGLGDCTSPPGAAYEEVTIDQIFVYNDTTGWTGWCNNGVTCVRNWNWSTASYTSTVPLAAGANQIRVRVGHGYAPYFRCPYQPNPPNPPTYPSCHGGGGCGGGNSCVIGTSPADFAQRTKTITYNAPGCVLVGSCSLNAGNPRVTLSWSPLSSPGLCDLDADGFAMERGAWGAPDWTDFYPSQCGGFWCGPKNVPAPYLDTQVTLGYSYAWRMKATAGVTSNTVVIDVSNCNCGGPCPPANDAQFVSISAPASVEANQPFAVQITMRNTGTGAWTSGSGYALQASSAANSALWSAATSVPVTGAVAPGATTVFTFGATAPGTPGIYPVLAWRTGQSGTGFGQSSPATNITVTPPNNLPNGANDAASCGGLAGWARDPDSAGALTVRVYRDNPATMGGVLVATLTANGSHAAPNNGYGYAWAPLIDGVPHPYYVYAEDAQTSQLVQLSGTPTAGLTCWPAPTATLTSVVQGDYCAGGPQATANWQYASAGNFPQTQWQLQAATDAGFAAIAYDSGVTATAPTVPPPSTHAGATGPGILQFATTYWFRVRAWDSQGQASVWSAPLTTTTAVSAYPGTAFTSAPAQVFAGQPVQFTDTSANGPTAWAWDFGDGQGDTAQNPSHVFAAQGSYPVKLDATNAAGTCSVTHVLDMKQALPSFREVRPGSGQ